jgi:hypothetical protein
MSVNTDNGNVYLWFIGQNRADTKLGISRKHDKFYVKFMDGSTNVNHNYKFSSYNELATYLDLLFDNILVDGDKETPIVQVQWDIPGFTSSLVDIQHMNNEYVYNTFIGCLEFYYNVSR